MAIGCDHHIPHLPKKQEQQKNLSFNYKQIEERNWDNVLQKAKPERLN